MTMSSPRERPGPSASLPRPPLTPPASRWHGRAKAVSYTHLPCAADPALRRVEDEKTLEAVRERYGLPERYLLFVGNFNPRKNLTRLMEAFDLLKSRPAGAGWKLVIAGEQGWKFDREKALAAIRCREDVLFPGYVAREDLGALYSMAEAFLFPSLYEGFGIPVIEAQQ